jgi:hypothetical protein
MYSWWWIFKLFGSIKGNLIRYVRGIRPKQI